MANGEELSVTLMKQQLSEICLDNRVGRSVSIVRKYGIEFVR